jgi:hypothetical protein
MPLRSIASLATDLNPDLNMNGDALAPAGCCRIVRRRVGHGVGLC